MAEMLQGTAESLIHYKCDKLSAEAKRSHLVLLLLLTNVGFTAAVKSDCMVHVHINPPDVSRKGLKFYP